MKRQKVVLAVICLFMATAAGLLAVSRSRHEVDLNSVLEIWADVVRDADRLGLTVTRVSVKREMEIGHGIEERIASHGRLTDDPKLLAYVADVGQALLPHIQRKAISYRFYVVDSPMINAFALPGGGIYITTKMLSFLQSEAELAAILGHEISHVDLRHCIERLQYEVAARKIGGDELAMITQIGYTLFGLGFSKQQELEADAGGVILAAKAGYDPRAAIATFERLAQFERKRQRQKPTQTPGLMVEEAGTALGKALEQYFATHPPTEDRIRQLQQVLERNARAWRGERFYVGRSNYYYLIPRSKHELLAEWQSY